MLNDGPVLVTGAAGFIGSHVCEALLTQGRPVIGLDNFDPFYDLALKRRNLELIGAAASRTGAGFRFVEADLAAPGSLDAALTPGEPLAGVVHLAARAGVRPSLEDPARYARVNVEGTVNLLEAIRASGASPSIALASSSSIYGNSPTTPFSESDPVAAPISPYAATKLACEHLAHTYHHLYGTPIACLRFFTVFGPRQRPDLAIAKFIDRIANGRPITLFGDGGSSRDYTFIDDIVAGVLASLERVGEHGCRVWNLGGSSPVALRDMVGVVERAVGRPAVVERGPAQPGDVARTYADLARATAELGFRPTTTLQEGVERQVEAYRAMQALAS